MEKYQNIVPLHKSQVAFIALLCLELENYSLEMIFAAPLLHYDDLTYSVTCMGKFLNFFFNLLINVSQNQVFGLLNFFFNLTQIINL